MHRHDAKQDPQAAENEGARTPLSPPFLRRKQAAALLGLSPRTLEDMARRGDGPPYFKPAGRGIVLYATAELLRWVEAGRSRPASDEPEVTA